MQAHKPTIVVDGAKFFSLEEFARYFSELMLDNHQWNGNLDAFNDILRGGFGTPINGFILRWENSALSRQRLGQSETIRWLEKHLQTCHPENVPLFERRLTEMQEGRGETLFDTIIQIIQEHGPGGKEAEDGIELQLV